MIVSVLKREWTRLGHGGLKNEVTYSVYLGDVLLARIGTYEFPRSAAQMAEDYARDVARGTGAQLVHGRFKRAA